MEGSVHAEYQPVSLTADHRGLHAMSILGLILLIVLFLALLGGLPQSPVWRGEPQYGYGPSGFFGLVLVIVLILVLLGRI
jgi:hypothetical protein